MAALVAVALAAAVVFSQAESKSQPDGPVYYRWTGAADDSQWSNAANWQFRHVTDQWMVAEAPPTDASYVIFGDATEADEPQLVELSYHVEIGRLIMAASGDRRSYTVRTRVDPDDTGIDSDSGMLYSLTLSEPLAIVQEAAVKQPLNLQVDLILTGGEGTGMELHSRHGAAVRAERSVLPAVGELAIVEGRDGASGKFKQVRPQLMFGR